MYITLDEFDQILKWKLRDQYNRQSKIRRLNNDKIVRQVTSLGLNIAHDNDDYELELRVKILCSLRGVGVPVASAILALTYPEDYGVIDYRAWRQIFDE